jgi:L-2-hydroxyglutarate oxidase LhgO
MQVDIAVVGAGVVGLACAHELARAGQSVVVIERHARVGTETSSRNSGVIHAGIYYPADSTKARLCVRGNQSLFAWCRRFDVRAQAVGKIIVATSSAEEATLDTLFWHARLNGVPALRLLSGAEVRAREPAVVAHAGILSATTGIVDVVELAASLRAQAAAHGCTFAMRHTLRAARRATDGYAIVVEDGDGVPSTLEAGAVVNAAGLEADTVAALIGIDIDDAGYRLEYVKGHYFRIARRGLVHGLVYPIPPADGSGLGIHATLDVDGTIRLGPDALTLTERKQDYTVPDALAERFLTAAHRFLPSVAKTDLHPDQSGIRPRLKKGPRDFVIAEESARQLPRWVNLVGIESPGLTCCLEIGSEVAALLRLAPVHVSAPSTTRPP